MSKNYIHQEIEAKWQNAWNDLGVYKWGPNDTNVFSIDTPPPTVSGSLHMGHIFSHTQTDFIARYHPIEKHDQKLHYIVSEDMKIIHL